MAVQTAEQFEAGYQMASHSYRYTTADGRRAYMGLDAETGATVLYVEPNAEAK